MSTQTFSVTSDNEVEQRFRTLTGYDATENEVPITVFDGILQAAKAKVYGETGSTNWYSDHHLGEVLVYTTAVIGKQRIENYSVEKWSIGSHSVTTTADDEESVLIQTWIDIINDNVENSDETDGSAGSLTPKWSGNYNW